MSRADPPPPDTPPASAIGLVDDLPISPEEKRRILEGNPKELFRL
jgi:predicted TIM-barrel fold metal-dependent hydrolase